MTNDQPLSEVATGRLQRPADFTGGKLVLFRQVLLRHGLVGLILASAFLLLAPHLLSNQLPPTEPLTYILGFSAILAVLIGISIVRYQAFNGLQIGWLFYLLFISVCEEWVFRVALPHLLETADILFPVLLSNALFGLVHYFTLRWKALWCLMAAAGGVGLSMHFQQHQDLLAIIGIHWLLTFINTPRPPRGYI